MNKICSNCAQESPSSATVCSLCGERLSETTTPALSSDAPPAQTNPAPQPPPASGTKAFCGSCGAQIDKSEKFCAKCGAATQAQLSFAQNQSTQSEQSEAEKSTKTPSHKKVGLIACAAVLIMVIGVGLIIFGGNSPESILTRYVEAMFEGNFNRMSRYSAIDISRMVSDVVIEDAGISEREFRESLYDLAGVRTIEELLQQDMERERERLERDLGRNLRVSVDIIDSLTVRGIEMRERISSLESILERVGIDVDAGRVIRLDRINEMIDFEIEITVAGRDDEMVDFARFTMVRIGRDWRVLEDFAHLPGFLGAFR